MAAAGESAARIEAGAEAGAAAGAEAGVEAGTEAGAAAGAEAGVEAGAEAGAAAGAEAGVEAGAEAGAVAGAEAGVEADGEVTVREARREDMPLIHHMIYELAAFEGMPDGPKLTVEDLIEDGFETSPAWFFALVAQRGAAVVGYALCNRAYSSWTRRAFYLEDLFVTPAARRRGVGTRLLQHLCQMAVREDVHRIDWHVLENNAGALALYAWAGARDLRLSEGRAALRLDRHRIEAVANGQF